MPLNQSNLLDQFANGISNGNSAVLRNASVYATQSVHLAHPGVHEKTCVAAVAVNERLAAVVRKFSNNKFSATYTKCCTGRHVCWCQIHINEEVITSRRPVFLFTGDCPNASRHHYANLCIWISRSVIQSIAGAVLPMVTGKAVLGSNFECIGHNALPVIRAHDNHV